MRSHFVQPDGGGLEDERFPSSFYIQRLACGVREEGRGGGDVLRHLRLLAPHQEGLQTDTVLLRGRRVELAEVHLDTECIVENISQSEGEMRYSLEPALVSQTLSHLIT